MTGPNRTAKTDRRLRKTRPRAKIMACACERCGAIMTSDECRNCGWLEDNRNHQIRPLDTYAKR